MKYLYSFIFFIFICISSQAQEVILCDPEVPGLVTDGGVVYHLPKYPDYSPPPPPPPPTPPDVGNRIIVWMHGLGGSDGSWERASTAVSDEDGWEINSQTPEYNEYSLQAAAISLQNNELSIHVNNAMDVENATNYSNNYIIAHSQGGLVSRTIDRLYTDNTAYGEDERLFGGIVTFGTSHGGAYILNSNMNGDLEDFGNVACEALGRGPALELYEGNWFTSLTNIDETVGGWIETAVGDACDVAASILIPQFILPDFDPAITEDYLVGAPMLETLDASNSTIPKVAFYGKEEDPVIWRTFSSLRGSVNNFDPFTADEDQELVDDVAANILEYEMKYLAYDNLEAEMELSGCPWWLWILTPAGCLVTEAAVAIFNSIDAENQLEEAAIRATAFYNGWQWWLNADEQWKTLIGAITFEEVTTNQCNCISTNSPEEFTSNVSEADCNFSGYFCQSSTATTYIRHEEGSDGIVPISSAIAFPGAATGIDKELTGSNHQQLRNDSNLEVKLTELYDGYHGDYFSVPPR